MNRIQNLPSGFKFAGLHSGIKDSKPDLALFLSMSDCAIAATYTQNKFRATSILRNETLTPTESGRAVLINSGNANACTGTAGENDNLTMVQKLCETFGIRSEQVLTLSTGIIGQPLPMSAVVNGITQLEAAIENNWESFDRASVAMLTSDNGPKTETGEFQMNGETVRIAGAAKGAGMIGPNMATMLAVLVTDAKMPADDLQQMLNLAVDRSFNCISVEGHTSTNDAVILMASGNGPSIETESAKAAFAASLQDVCVNLAKKIPADGEGASHLIEIRVEGAENKSIAEQVARTVAQSNLVKTAVTGNDPNWGRIMSAVGNVPVDINPQKCDLKINGTVLFLQGQPVDFDEKAVSTEMRKNFTVRIEISLGTGPGSAFHWTSDLTSEYVHFNSEYTT